MLGCQPGWNCPWRSDSPTGIVLGRRWFGLRGSIVAFLGLMGLPFFWVLALAIGGIREAWLLAIVGVIASGAAGAVGALAPGVGWKAPLVVGILLVLYLFFA